MEESHNQDTTLRGPVCTPLAGLPSRMQLNAAVSVLQLCFCVGVHGSLPPPPGDVLQAAPPEGAEVAHGQPPAGATAAAGSTGIIRGHAASLEALQSDPGQIAPNLTWLAGRLRESGPPQQCSPAGAAPCPAAERGPGPARLPRGCAAGRARTAGTSLPPGTGSTPAQQSK